MNHNKPSEVIIKARKNMGLTQKEFGEDEYINKSQCEISRYENEKADPPADIIIHCMHIINTSDDKVEADEIIKKFKLLTGDKHKNARASINHLLDFLINIQQ